MTELQRQSKELFGIKLYTGEISKVCKGKRDKYNGYTFQYVN